jgi:hypothetical protein
LKAAIESATAIAVIIAAHEPAASVEATASIESTASVEAAIPRTGADKDAAGEPLRPVEAVRSARVRIIVIVAVLADRSRADVGRTSVNRTNSDTDGEPLSVCQRYRKQADTDKGNNL